MALLRRTGNVEQLKQENVRLKRTLYELSTLNELAQVINSTMPVKKVMDQVVARSVKAIDAEQGTIHLIDKSTHLDDPFKTFIRKADAANPISEFRLDVELGGWMIRNTKPLLINDFAQNSQFINRAAGDLQIKSLLAVPLLYKSQIIGVLTLFNKKTSGGFTTDDQRLLSIVATQSAQIIENARLYEQEKQLLKIEKELEMARSIQMRLLPKRNPDIPGFDVAGLSHPAREVGGDYFDFIQISEKRWCIALGDVAGKGIPAAMLMSHLQATMRYQAASNNKMADCLREANNVLNYNMEEDRFVTMFAGFLDFRERRFEFVNAGHNYPIYFRADGSMVLLETGGLVMGMLPDISYLAAQLHLTQGELLVIYSDGISEAQGEDEEQFGEERVKQVVNKHKDQSATEIANAIFEAADAYSTQAEQGDDMTVVVLKTL